MRPLTRALRHETCVHEAGHAISFALGGVPVLRLAVAPEGADRWRTDIRTGRCCTDLWGLCEKADLVFPRPFMRWLGSEGVLHPNGQGFEDILDTPVGQAQLDGFAPAQRRDIRAHVVGLLGGPLAECILNGRPATLHALQEFDDVARAARLCRFLRAPDALSTCFALAEQALRHPGTWTQLLRLADRLEQEGEVKGDLRSQLPATLPGWLDD